MKHNIKHWYNSIYFRLTLIFIAILAFMILVLGGVLPIVRKILNIEVAITQFAAWMPDDETLLIAFKDHELGRKFATKHKLEIVE